MKQCLDKDRCFDKFEKDHCRRDDFCTSSHERSDEWGFGEWIPIIIIVFLLCGGTNIFGGFFGRDDCCERQQRFWRQLVTYPDRDIPVLWESERRKGLFRRALRITS